MDNGERKSWVFWAFCGFAVFDYLPFVLLIHGLDFRRLQVGSAVQGVPCELAMPDVV